MDHNQAVNDMVAEQYLLDELTPELREAFEEHVFDCMECANDLRAGAMFVSEAKEQLPALVASSNPAGSPVAPVRKKSTWSLFWKPVFAVPAFAALLAVIGFQNLSTIPGLQAAADQPRLLPWTSVHAGSRGGNVTDLAADPKQGAVLLLNLPQNSSFTSYAFDLYDPHGKRFWSSTNAAPAENDGGDRTISLFIPGAGIEQGNYALSISGINSQGGRTEIDRHAFHVHLDQ